MTSEEGEEKFIYKVVLTGGPCGGKTTCINRIGTFFEELGWKVFRIPEAAYIFMSGGLKFPDLDDAGVYQFQSNLIKCMMRIEDTFKELAESDRNKKVLIVCDRGVMDSTAYMKPGQRETTMSENNWEEVDLRDKRYNQVVHLVSAARGAESFYSLSGHGTRHETIEVARELDDLVAEAWLGHPYYDVVDNSTGFEQKINRTIQTVCERVGIDAADRLAPQSRKRKFLVTLVQTELAAQQNVRFQDFTVLHHYLNSTDPYQIRVRKRGNGNQWTYGYTVRNRKDNVETKRMISKRDYQLLLAQTDPSRLPVLKTRRCFIWRSQHYHLDIFEEPCHPRCKGLILLETYTTLQGKDLVTPDFLDVQKELTGDSSYSMFNLCLRYMPGDSRSDYFANSAPSDADCADCVEAAHTLSVYESELNRLSSTDTKSTDTANNCGGMTPVMKGLGVSAQRKKLLTDVLQGSFSVDLPEHDSTQDSGGRGSVSNSFEHGPQDGHRPKLESSPSDEQPSSPSVPGM